MLGGVSCKQAVVQAEEWDMKMYEAGPVAAFGGVHFKSGSLNCRFAPLILQSYDLSQTL